MGQGGLKLFIDECLSPRIAEWLCDLAHDAIHPLHVGRRGENDYTVLRRCLEEDRIIITENGEDFRDLVGKQEVHPGLRILPCTGRDRAWELLLQALEFLENGGDVADTMVNHVLEVDDLAQMTLFPMAA